LPLPQRSELSGALASCRGAFVATGLISAMSNLLMLTGAMFMLQVYDRVLPSRSVPTLIGLAGLAAGLYAAQGLLDPIRGRSNEGAGPMRDLDSVRVRSGITVFIDVDAM
jgi:ABC-type protease/lipase transport system fused ATPase/permease subunit